MIWWDPYFWKHPYIYCEGTRIHGSFDRKNRHHFCAQNFAASPHFIPKIIAAPASMLITMAGTAPGRSIWAGPHRDIHHYMAGTAPGPRWHTHLWPGPHWDALYYGRDCTGAQFTMAGTAPGHSWLWPGPHRDRADTLITMAGTALRCSLLWPGPHRDGDCYGRDRHTVWTLQSNLKGVGGWRLPHLQASVFHPVTKP